MVKRLHWTDMGMCLDVAPDNRPLYVTASDYDAAQARIRELEAQQAKLVRAVAEARGQSGLLKADKRICELEAVLRTVPHEPGSLIAKVLAGSPTSEENKP
jgi:hypothetical protein